MRPSVRPLAWIAIGAQAVFVTAWIVAGAMEPGYSGADSGISALAARGMHHAWIVMAGFVVLGLGVAALGPVVRAVLPRRPATTVAAVLLAVAGAGLILAALSRLDCDLTQAACDSRFDAGRLSWHTDLHLWAGVVTRLAVVLTPFALARALWPSPTAALSFAAGGTGVAIGAAGWILYGTGAPDGVVERVELGTLHLWVLIVAAGILYETRRAPKLSAPAPLRPRDFFGSAWKGEGVVLGLPAFLWRRVAPRFALSRETTWHSDEVAVVRDRAVLGNGRVEERVRFAHFRDPSHIHVSGDDMPEGADVTIDESGYRVAPYRILVPVGPLRFMVNARDRASIAQDGTLSYLVLLRWHGLPVARVEMRARPVDTAHDSAEPGAQRPRSPVPTP